MNRKTMTTWMLALVCVSLVGVVGLGAKPAEGVYPSEEQMRNQLRPAGEFVPTVQRLVDQLESGAVEGEQKCNVARRLGHMFWWLTESERQSIDQNMIQGLTDVLRSAADDDEGGCVEVEMARALGLIGPPARAALPDLKARLVAIQAIMDAQDAKNGSASVAPRLFPAPEGRLDYVLARAIAQIDLPEKPGRLK
jgi:hypothetical protein